MSFCPQTVDIVRVRGVKDIWDQHECNSNKTTIFSACSAAIGRTQLGVKSLRQVDDSS